MLIDHLFFSDSIVFSSFGQSHFYAVFAATILLIILISAAKRLSDQQNLMVSRGLSLLLCTTVVAWSLLHIRFGRFSADESLPLSICNLFALIAPLLFWIPHQKRFEVVYYFVFSGTLQAIITPDPSSGYPSYSFFKYWILHCGLIIIVAHYLMALKLYPSAQGIVRAFIWLNLYLPYQLVARCQLLLFDAQTSSALTVRFFRPMAILPCCHRDISHAIFCSLLFAFFLC